MFAFAIILFILIAAARGFGFTAHPILSGSMEPAIKTGSLALVKNVPVSTLTVGDVIAFRPEDRSIGIAHRIIEINNENGEKAFTTKGDANNSPDAEPYVARTTQIGKIFFSLPYMGYLFTFLQTKDGFLIMVGLFIMATVWVFWPRETKTRQGTDIAIESTNKAD